MRLARRSRSWTNISLAICLLVAIGLTGGGVPFTAATVAVARANAPHISQAAPTASSAAQLSAARATIDRLPMVFEAAGGTSAAGVRFLSRGNGYALYLTDTDAILLAGAGNQSTASGHSTGKQTATLRFHLAGANAHPSISGLDRQQTTVNYFVGSNSQNWRTGVPTYGGVVYRNVYPGVNLVYYGTQDRLEYDFQLAPGAKPGIIRLAISGASGLTIDAHGNLIIATAAGGIVQTPPTVYQQAGRQRRIISSRYQISGKQTVGFVIGSYDPRLPLVIDPVVPYWAILGSNTTVAGVAVDKAGDSYITGTTYTAVITSTNALQPAYNPGYCPSNSTSPCPVVYVEKINPKGDRYLFGTFLAGAYGTANYASGIAVDSLGFAYVVGYTNAGLEAVKGVRGTTFPVTNGAFQRSFCGANDAFLSKISPDGHSLIYSTLLGGATDNNCSAGDNIGTGIVVDRMGAAYLTGYTYAWNFPVKNGLLGSLGYGKGALGTQVDAFVTKFNPSGSKLIYSTYLGGSGTDYGYGIALDPSGDAYVIGQTNSIDFQIPTHSLQPHLAGTDLNSFIAKLNANGNRLVYATYFGASAADKAHGIAVDTAGSAYVVGETNGGIHPTVGLAQVVSGATHGFIAKFSARGVLVYATYIGGSGVDIANAVAVDGRTNAYVAGSTTSAEFSSPSFPLVKPLQPRLGSNRGGFGMSDAFVVKINSCGTKMLYSTYLGGTFAESAQDIAVDGAGSVYLGGVTSSPNFLAGEIGSYLPGGRKYIPPNPNAFVARIPGLPEPAPGICPIPLILELSSTALSVASTVPLTATIHTAPFAKVDLTLAVTNTVAPPPPPATPTPLPGEKPVKIKLPHYPKVGETIYTLHVGGTADAYGLYIGVLHPKAALTVVEPAVLIVSAAGSRSKVFDKLPLTVGP